MRFHERQPSNRNKLIARAQGKFVPIFSFAAPSACHLRISVCLLLHNYIYDQSNDLRERFKLEITLTTPLYKTCSIGVRSWFVLDLLTHFCKTGTGIGDQKVSCHYQVKYSYTD